MAKQSKAPRVMVDVPLYWTLPASDQKKIDALMRRVAADREQREAKLPRPLPLSERR